MKFKSLDILSDGISYIQTAIARISGLLLMLGLIVAMANLLQDDSVFRTAPWLQAWWAWSQSIAVDSGLALVFVRLFEAIAARNKPKTWSYGVIGGMLAFVAITITSIESIRQVFGISIQAASALIYVPLLILTVVRSIVSVGLVAVSGIDIMAPPAPTPIKEDSLPAPLLKQPTNKKATSNGNGRGEKGVRVLEYLTINPNADDLTVMAATLASRSTVRNYKKKLAGASPWKGLAGKEEEVAI